MKKQNEIKKSLDEILKEKDKVAKKIQEDNLLELQLVVRAEGLNKGRCYYCPNKHPYLISNCGRAVREAKCPACNEKIGGKNKVLTKNNTEIKGLPFN